MRRKLFLRILLFVSIIPMLTACEGLDGCMTCQLNTYENGVLVIEGAESEYCAERLIAIQAIQDVVDPPYTYKWECR